MSKAKELQKLEKNIFGDPDTRDFVVRTLGKYKDETIKIVTGDLAKIYEKTRDASVVRDIAKIVGKYEDEYVRGIAFYLSAVASYIKDVDTVRFVAKTVEKYDDSAAFGVGNVFSRTSVITRDTSVVRDIANIMSTDEVVDVIGKFEADCVKGDYVHSEILREFLNGLGEVAMFTKDPNAVRDVVKIAGENKQYERFLIRNLFRPLGSIAEHTRDANAVRDVVRLMGKYEGFPALRIAGAFGDIAEEIKDGVVFRKFLKSIESLEERDAIIARLLRNHAVKVYVLFGDKYVNILNYFERRKDRNSLLKIRNIHNLGKIAEDIKKIKLSNFGNKQAKRLIQLAYLLDYSYQLELNSLVSENLQATYSDVESSLGDYMTTLGIKDIDKGIRFVPWIATKDQTVLKVLRGEKVEKNGIPKTYTLKNESGINLRELREDIQYYANIAREPIDVEDGDLAYLKNMAEIILSNVKKRKNIEENVLGEVVPNLSRILKLRDEHEMSYILSVNPPDLESQMIALQKISSCLSPEGCYFRYTRQYLANPNTFWSVIKNDVRNIVGRVTVFMGIDDENKRRLARVSKVYSTIPVSGKTIDGNLIEYSKEMGTEFMRSGEMFVEGLDEVYDDYVRGKNGRVVITR